MKKYIQTGSVYSILREEKSSFSNNFIEKVLGIPDSPHILTMLRKMLDKFEEYPV